MIHQENLQIATRGRGALEITGEVTEVIARAGITIGLCHLFLHHTSASLCLCENADPTVLRDLEEFMSRMVPDGNPRFRHTLEGPDDMPAHIRSVLTGNDLTIPVSGGRGGLGTWQGIFLWEQRTRPHSRQLTITVQGE